MRSRLIAAFAAVYVIWGSTYLAIRFAVETLPPMLMIGTRFIVAGSLLLLWAVFRDRQRPTARAPRRATGRRAPSAAR
jgi:drug/metabolite transporter (DMT)-like permease